MKTAFQNGPGFFSASSHEHNPRVPAGMMRVYCVRLEAYDIDGNDPEDPGLETSFEVLFAQAEGHPEIAHMLLHLSKSIEANRELLEHELKR